MLGKIYFLSAKKMAEVVPTPHAIVVSILDKSDAPHRPDFTDFKSSLILEFSDWAEEFAEVAVGDWDDNPTAEMHRDLANAKDELLPSLNDALKIVEFVHQYHGIASETFDLYVHCMGGISRSAAVAVWAAGKYRLPIGNTDSHESPNPRVLRLLFKADEQIRLKDRAAFFKPN